MSTLAAAQAAADKARKNLHRLSALKPSFGKVVAALVSDRTMGTQILGAAPATVSTEGVGSDGGYLVPPDVSAELADRLLGEDSILAYTRRQVVDSNSATFPVDAAPPWTGTGIQVRWEGEQQLVQQTKVAAQGAVVRLGKVEALIPVSNELMEDAQGLAQYLDAAIGDRVVFKLNDAILNGDGVKKPLGVLGSPALLSQAAEGGQTAGTIVLANAQKMVAKLYGPSRRRALWLANPDAVAQVSSFAYPNWVPAGLAGPLPRLLGIPVLETEACAAVGSAGDLVLVDPHSIASATRTESLQTDVSFHVFFDVDASAVRVRFRVHSQPIWAGPIARPGARGNVSTFVALAAR